jgi:hypothetical protein
MMQVTFGQNGARRQPLAQVNRKGGRNTRCSVAWPAAAYEHADRPVDDG